MNKKLPGLSRRAPEIPESGNESLPEPPEPAAPPSSDAPAPAVTAAARKRARARPERRDEASASDGERTIQAELLPPEDSDAAFDRRIDEALKIVEHRVNWALASGLIPLPIPFIDAAAIFGVQMKMLSELSDHYGVPFEHNRAKSILMSLIGGIVPYFAGAGIAGMIGRTMPVIGWGVGMATVSVLGAATTQATGVVFIKHFEMGGTLFDFEPGATRKFYRQEFERARKAGTKR